jgi:CheY-like chemotaxis protein
MPIMNGLEATIKIRELSSSLHPVYICACTANAMSGDSERCIDAGMNMVN